MTDPKKPPAPSLSADAARCLRMARDSTTRAALAGRRRPEYLRLAGIWRERARIVPPRRKRATSEATAPGAIAAATIRSFSARGHRRRRCTDVITSTAAFVIGLSLGLAL